MAQSNADFAILGNVGRPPEVTTTKDGRKIVTLSIAINERYTRKGTNEKVDVPHWFRVVCFNPGLNDILTKYVKSGDKIQVEGSMRTSDYDDKQGVKRYSTDLILAGPRARVSLLTPRPQEAMSQPQSA